MWYNTLNKSPLTPPPLTFSIVWPILYVLMFISLFLYLKTFSQYNPGMSMFLSLGFIFFIIQLVLNLSWSPVFFQQQQICFSILIILGILLFLFLTMFYFYQVSPLATYLLIPYALWSLFALYLNMYICFTN